MGNNIETKLKEVMRKVSFLPNYKKIEKIIQSWVYDRRKGGLKATLAYQRMKSFIELDEQSLVEYLKTI